MKELLEEAYSEADEKFISLVECYATGKNDDNIRDMVLKLYDSRHEPAFSGGMAGKMYGSLSLRDTGRTGKRGVDDSSLGCSRRKVSSRQRF